MLRTALLGIAMLGLVSSCGGIGKAKSEVRTAVDGKKSSLDSCYAKALSRDKAASGSMTLKLTVKDGTNQIDKIEIVDPGFADGQLQSCVEGALAGMTITSKPKANVEIEYIFQFTPAS